MSQEPVFESQEPRTKKRGRKPKTLIDQPSNYNKEKEDPIESHQEPVAKEKYYRVKFHPKSHPNDTPDVSLGVNNEVLTIKRGDVVIIPSRFKECADRTLTPHYSQEPGKDLKVTSWIKIYGYDIISEDVPESEYFAQKSMGDKATREHWKKEANVID